MIKSNQIQSNSTIMITIIFFLLIFTCTYNFIIGSFLEEEKDKGKKAKGKKNRFKKKIVWRGYKLLKIPNIYIWLRRYTGLGGAGERENLRRIRYNHWLAKYREKLKAKSQRDEKRYQEKAKRERWWRWLLWGR